MSRAAKVYETEVAQRVGVAPAPDEAGQDTGLVEVKTRVPIHLHIALSSVAERNARSLAGEMRYALQQHVERELRR